ncbi:hypothetical protein HNP46_006327 [Pseudomonas nitritireducens]|uniref:Uncharacterized protein n=1 Tax=Pseudomonas nitroreducens TaxID=46680 RepID=A0A7W7KRT1_PSENT|nr:hypothetical protein [Pseudomonas nitritireducens]MBB4867414.1 hypothetical protein [Pseudomonas nitritireducens]
MAEQTYQLSLTLSELLEMEQEINAAERTEPEEMAAVDSVSYKIGLLLNRPWALKKRAELQQKG